jgi:hypothetical protein
MIPYKVYRCNHIVTWNSDYSVSWRQLVCGTMGGGTVFKNIFYCKKGKVIPLQTWTSPDGSRRLSRPEFI